MKKLVAFLTIIIWSISMAASAHASMSVLCIENGGKTVIENSTTGTNCLDTVTAVKTGQSVFAEVQCADCVDTPLYATSANVPQRTLDKVVLTQIATYVTAFLHLSPHTSGEAVAVAAEAAPTRIRSAYIGQRNTIVIQQ